MGVGGVLLLRRASHRLGHLEEPWQRGKTLPVLLSATESEESGRGLALVDALAECWGVVQGADCKTVWCELRS